VWEPEAAAGPAREPEEEAGPASALAAAAGPASERVAWAALALAAAEALAVRAALEAPAEPVQ
jgi:hypothetical protein